MKALARSHIWWPDIDKEIEEKAMLCTACPSTKNSPAKAPLHPWSWASAPWENVHVDYAGLFLGKMFLVVADFHSKWLEILLMSSTTSPNTVAVLRYGIPQQLVSDNRPQFMSEKFRGFLAANMSVLRHIIQPQMVLLKELCRL